VFNYTDYNTVTLEGKRFYALGGDKYYPSITTVLGNTQDEATTSVLNAWRARVGNAAAQKKTEDAAQRGTNTHLMLERFLKGEDPKLHEFPDAHVKIFNSLRLELKKINKVYGQEVVLFSDDFRIAGRCDLVAEYQGELAIVDYKTSSRVKSKDEIGDYWKQAAFYASAHNEMFGTDIKKLVILMGVENHLPLVFKKMMDEELIVELALRTEEFYNKL
jgi:ATP-dependent exoDNAse (exonuclease V) beta subunit